MKMMLSKTNIGLICVYLLLTITKGLTAPTDQPKSPFDIFKQEHLTGLDAECLYPPAIVIDQNQIKQCSNTGGSGLNAMCAGVLDLADKVCSKKDLTLNTEEFMRVYNVIRQKNTTDLCASSPGVEQILKSEKCLEVCTESSAGYHCKLYQTMLYVLYNKFKDLTNLTQINMVIHTLPEYFPFPPASSLSQGEFLSACEHENQNMDLTLLCLVIKDLAAFYGERSMPKINAVDMYFNVTNQDWDPCSTITSHPLTAQTLQNCTRICNETITVGSGNICRSIAFALLKLNEIELLRKMGPLNPDVMKDGAVNVNTPQNAALNGVGSKPLEGVKPQDGGSVAQPIGGTQLHGGLAVAQPDTMPQDGLSGVQPAGGTQPQDGLSGVQPLGDTKPQGEGSGAQPLGDTNPKDVLSGALPVGDAKPQEGLSGGQLLGGTPSQNGGSGAQLIGGTMPKDGLSGALPVGDAKPQDGLSVTQPIGGTQSQYGGSGAQLIGGTMPKDGLSGAQPLGDTNLQNGGSIEQPIGDLRPHNEVSGTQPVGDTKPQDGAPVDQPQGVVLGSQPVGDTHQQGLSGAQPVGDAKPQDGVSGAQSVGDIKPQDGVSGEQPVGDIKPQNGVSGVQPVGDIKPLDGVSGAQPVGDVKPQDGVSGAQHVGDVKPQDGVSGAQPVGDVKPQEGDSGPKISSVTVQPVLVETSTDEYSVTTDEESEEYDDDGVNSQFGFEKPDGIVTNKENKSPLKSEKLNEEQHFVGEKDEAESAGISFMSYFLVFLVLCVAGYIVFHNKQKIIALVIEGKNAPNGRRPNTKEYRRLKTDDVMPSLEKSATDTNYVY